MAVRGAQSKKVVEEKILEMFPGSFIADKKVYIPFREDNEPVQIAITMTCPKGLVGHVEEETGEVKAPPQKTSIEFTPEEKETIEMLLSKL